MLRTKQIATLSRSARSIFFSGSRCTGAEGSSCFCTDDETCVSRKQRRCNEVLPSQNTSTLATKCLFGIIPRTQHSECQTGSKASERAGSLLSGDAAGTVGCQNKDSFFSTYFSQKDISDHFVKAGIAAFVFLSDLVNYKLPISDGNGVLFSTQNCMVDSTGSTSNIRSSSGKPHRRDNSKTHGRVFVETTGGSNSIKHNHGPKAKVEKGGSVKGFDRVPNVASNSQETHGVPLDTRDERQSAPHRIKTKLNHSFTKSKPDEQTSEAKVQKPLRSNFPIKTTTARHPINSGQAVERFYHILRQVKWGPAAENALRNLNCTLDAYQANQILKQLQDHSVALNFFYWLKRQRGFKHDGHSYTTMIGILGRARQFGAIDRLLDEMVRDGCEPNVVTYNRLIHSYGRANYLDEAVRVFYRMQGVGCKPDRVTYCTLIDIHAKAGFLDIAMDMYRRMQVAGLSPDTFTYSVIINCLGKGGHLASAYKLFCEMISMGCVPNLVTYNIMIALQAKARNYPCALKLYRDMQNAGFQPDKVTYSIVMEVLGHCGYLDEVEALFAEMKCKNWVPDEHVYGLLVDLWGKAGNVPKAREWYQAMLNAGLCPNVPTCNSLLSAFLRVHYFSDAYNVLQSMLQLGLQPSLQTYTLLLSCCTDTQSPRDMVFCGELMAITGHPAHAFLSSMPASGLDGQNVRDHANTFLDLMHSEDRESKRGLVDAVIDFLHKSGLKEEAGSVWEVAAQKNVYPDAVREKSSCYWLINLHVMSDGTAVTALSRTFAWFRRQMLLSGKGPSRIDIVTGWGRRSRVTGSSLVRQAVQELLHIFRFPFYTENGNSGCFVGCGESLNRWLLQSYVERMHLL